MITMLEHNETGNILTLITLKNECMRKFKFKISRPPTLNITPMQMCMKSLYLLQHI